MSSSESDATDSCVSEDEEGKIYQLIFDLIPKDEKEGKEEDQIPPRVLPDTVANNDTKGLDMDALDSVQDIPQLKGNAECSEEKPWRSAGANISDYFNYGFDEESWNTYCKEHAEVGAATGKLYAESTVLKGHTSQEEDESCSAYPSSGRPASRLPRATNDVFGGRPGSRRRVKGHNSQMATETSPEADRFTSYLPSPYIFNSLFAYISPPPYLYRSGPPPPSPFATLDSGHSKGFDDSSTSLHPCSSGVSSLIPRNMAYNAGVIDTAKAWKCYIRQEECDKDRDRSRERGHDKGSSGGRDRDRERCSSSHSGEERMRQRDNAERRHTRHSSDGFSERHEGRSHSEGSKKSSSSSGNSSRKSRRDGQSRDRNKKAKK